MASTDLMTYLNYISTWETESDANIDCLISEHNLFLNLGDFESDSIVDKEMGELHKLACEVRDSTIAQDAMQMAADVAAVAAIWTFGLGMAAFAAFEAGAQIAKATMSSKSKALHEKLTTVDTDISSQINSDVKDYVSKYKANNNLIVSKAPKGLDTKTCRSHLMQFMAEVQRKNKTLDAKTFRKYAESARIVFNSEEINKVYDALDELNLSDRSDEDVKKLMDVIAGLKFPGEAELSLVRNIAIAIMAYKLKIANATIKAQAEAAGIPVEEVEASAFGTMDAVGKFVAVVAVAMSVVDIVLNIIDIVDVVKQCEEWCDKLDSSIKDSYKSYFNGIKKASQNYKEAISVAD